MCPYGDTGRFLLFKEGSGLHDFGMSKTEILAELPNLSAKERMEIRSKLAELDGDAWLDAEEPLTEPEKALLESRLAAYEKDPDAGSSWEEMESRIKAQLSA